MKHRLFLLITSLVLIIQCSSVKEGVFLKRAGKTRYEPAKKVLIKLDYLWQRTHDLDSSAKATRDIANPWSKPNILKNHIRIGTLYMTVKEKPYKAVKDQAQKAGAQTVRLILCDPIIKTTSTRAYRVKVYHIDREYRKHYHPEKSYDVDAKYRRDITGYRIVAVLFHRFTENEKKIPSNALYISIVNRETSRALSISRKSGADPDHVELALETHQRKLAQRLLQAMIKSRESDPGNREFRLAFKTGRPDLAWKIYLSMNREKQKKLNCCSYEIARSWPEKRIKDFIRDKKIYHTTGFMYDCLRFGKLQAFSYVFSKKGHTLKSKDFARIIHGAMLSENSGAVLPRIYTKLKNFNFKNRVLSRKGWKHMLESALYKASSEEYNGVKFLLNKGVNPDCFIAVSKRMVYSGKKKYSTPLHNAVRKGNVRIVKLLLKHGANPLSYDSEYKKPSQYCRKNKPGSNEIAAILRISEKRKRKR